MTTERNQKFLEEAASYFESRTTHGEDKAYWSNVYNAENCRRIARRLAAMQAALEGLEKYLDEETARAFTEMNKARQDGDDEWATIHQRVRDAYSDATMRARAALSQKDGGKE